MSCGVCFEERNAFFGYVRERLWIISRCSFSCRLNISWRFGAFFFSKKVVLVMDSGCSLRGTLRASRQECCDYTLSDAVSCLAPSLQQKFIHIFTHFPRSRVVFCIYEGGSYITLVVFSLSERLLFVLAEQLTIIIFRNLF